MKPSLYFATYSLILLSAISVHAEDLGWLRPGVRAWYHGATGLGGTGATNAEEAVLIKNCTGFSCTVLKHQAASSWTQPLPMAKIRVPNAASEGEFWINPVRLASLKPVKGSIVWKGTRRYVVSRSRYSIETVPFILKWQSLALQQLFAEASPREVVYLKNSDSDLSIGHFYFDIKTGLLLHYSLQQAASATHLTISEINYDFRARSAFAEDLGPHTGFAALYNASKVDYVHGMQGFLFNPVILSRHRNQLLMTFVGHLSNAGWTANPMLNWTSYLSYDGDSGVTRERDYADENAPWKVTGDHMFWWIPPTHLTRDRINVVGLELVNRKGDGATTKFDSLDIPSGMGFTSLSYDSLGYLTALAVADPELALYVDSADAFSNVLRVDGLSYFTGYMEPASPSLAKNPTFRGLKNRYQMRSTKLEIPFAVGEPKATRLGYTTEVVSSWRGKERFAATTPLKVMAVSGDISQVPQKSLGIVRRGDKFFLVIHLGKRLKKWASIALVARSSAGLSFKSLQILPGH